MLRLIPLIKKELGSFFNTPVAYILGVSFLVFQSVWFFFLLRFPAANEASLRGYFGVMPAAFVVLIPALSMRSWAEERRMGTAELYLTLPYREGELVLAKFLAAFLLLLLLLALTLPIPLSLRPLGDFEIGEILGEYIGIILLGGAALSLGQFASMLSGNQISAFLLGFFSLLFLTGAHLAGTVPGFPRALAELFRYLSFSLHYESFRKGVLDSRDLVFFLLLTLFFQYLSVQALILRKRG